MFEEYQKNPGKTKTKNNIKTKQKIETEMNEIAN